MCSADCFDDSYSLVSKDFIIYTYIEIYIKTHVLKVKVLQKYI